MTRRMSWPVSALVALGLLFPTLVPAHDVDGPNDCARPTRDLGDAPEGSDAYPGVPGHFPTCIGDSAPGTQSLDCAPISTPPGLTGFVLNLNPNAEGYWLGCGPAATGPMGIDSESDGKVNSSGAASSFCDQTLLTDCVEAAFGMNFGQDECYGDDDAGITSPITFACCASATVTFKTYNCLPAKTVFLNILVDWNQDGDWNDNMICQSRTSCAYEWAVKNVPITLPTGCTTLNSPAFQTGTKAGHGWLRITISDDPVTDDFPWAGSARTATGALFGGETEDYPVEIVCPQNPCDLGYTDLGDAPKGIAAYPGGVIGHFPSCMFPYSPGTQELFCPPISTAPGFTGFVEHVALAGDPVHFWLGCGPSPHTPPGGIDSEPDAKINTPAVGTSACPHTFNPTDCIETAFGGMTFDQDECYGDVVDAGIVAPVSFVACSTAVVAFDAYSCGPAGQPQEAYLNILVDWNEDGDWNDNFKCGGTAAPGCAYEWAVKNALIALPSGCTTMLSPSFLTGPRPGNGWMRVTLTAAPVTDDFPWAGSSGVSGLPIRGGETEDYPVTITPKTPPDPCNSQYLDFGDAPEELPAYPSGIIGHFPTCILPTGPGTQSIACGTALSTPPGPTGYVEHVAAATDPVHFWLGCGGPLLPSLGIDTENDGKVNFLAAAGTPSNCDPAVFTDCVEPAFGGMSFGQDECVGDDDAGISVSYGFPACDLTKIQFEAYNCGTVSRDVFVNVLLDWNQDGDWNDVVRCGVINQCAPEWAVKNAVIVLPPGCSIQTTPQFRVGPNAGPSWMRVTLTSAPVTNDFPWAGSANLAGGAFQGGETEDYPVTIVPSLIGVGEEARPKDLWLASVSPNPSRERTNIRFALPHDGEVSVSIYDVSGRKLRQLVSGILPAGEHSVPWDYRDQSGAQVPAGLYLVKLQAENRVLTQRAIRVK